VVPDQDPALNQSQQQGQQHADDAEHDDPAPHLRDLEPALELDDGAHLAIGMGRLVLQDGLAHGLSPDGAWVLASQQGRLLALPTAAGEPRRISEGFFDAIRWASWFRDGKRVLVWAQGKSGNTGIFVVDPQRREPQRIAPEGYELGAGGNALSPDGRMVVARSPENQVELCPVDGGAPRPVPGLAGLLMPVQWMADGKSFYVFRLGGNPARVEKIDVETGHATIWKELAPPDPAGTSVRAVVMTPDAKSYAYSCQQYLTTLYLVENLESWQRSTIWSRLFGTRR